MERNEIIFVVVLIAAFIFCGFFLNWYFNQDTQYKKDIGIYHKSSVPFNGECTLIETKKGWIDSIYKVHYVAKEPTRIVIISPADDEFMSEIRFDKTFENETVDIFVPKFIAGNDKMYIVHNNTYEIKWIGPVWTS
jgi:hypothetical protein